MAEGTQPAVSDEARAAAAQFLELHAAEVERITREAAERLSAELDADGRDVLVAGLVELLGQMPMALTTPDDATWPTLLQRLAQHAHAERVPYPTVSRSLRDVKRGLMRLFTERSDIRPPAPVYDAVESQIDEARLTISSAYHAFAERRLRDSEQLTRFLLNNIQEAVLVVDLDTGAVTMANATAVRLLGYSREDLLARTLLELVAPEQAEPVAAALARVAVTHTFRFHEVALVTAGLTRLPVAMQLTVARADADRRLVQVSMRDLTAETEALAAHETEAAYLRAFVADTADAVILLDREERITSWNKGAERTFGYSADEILNRHADVLLPADVRTSGEMDRLAAEVEREGYVRNHETVRRTRDGRRIDVNLTRTAIFDPLTGEWVATSVVLRDVTDRKRLEREAQRQTRQLQIINGLLEATVQSIDRDQILRAIPEQLRDVLPFELMTLSSLEPDGTMLRVRVLAGAPPLPGGNEDLVELQDTLEGRVVSERTPLSVANLLDARGLGAEDRLLAELGYRSFLAVPLVHQNEMIGVLALLHREPDSYDDEDQELLLHVGRHIAVALGNARRYEEEKKRGAQFELISRVGATAIANIGDVSRLLHGVVDTIQSDFGYHDVALYEVDEEAGVFRLAAQAGVRRQALGEGYEQPLDVGIFAQVLQTRSSYLAADVTEDTHYFNPTPDVPTVRSELCVPIRVGPEVFGILDLEHQRVNGFDRLDRAAMEGLAGILARCMQADKGLRETRMLQALRQHIMEAVPSALILLDSDLRVQFVNKRYCEFFRQNQEDIMHRHVTEIFPKSLIERSRFLMLVEELQQTQNPIDQREVRYFDFEGQERYVDVRLRIVTEQQTNVVVMLHDATNRMQRLYQLSMLREIGEEMQRLLDTDRLLRAILTCVTAGPGFGFNRAALFMLDLDQNALVERMRVGPESREQAGEIWMKVGHRKSLREFLREYDQSQLDHAEATPALSQRSLPLSPEDEPLRRWRTPLLLRQDEEQATPVANILKAFSGAPEVLVVPLVSQETVLGLVVADNLYTEEPISRDNIRMLTTFASQAGLALANAQAFAETQRSLAALREAQSQLRRAEQLAGIGSVAAHVAHEIRNPLVSIGGFARRIAGRPEDPEYVENRVGIIIKEVARLEQILKHVADFTAPGQPVFAECRINAVIEDVLNLQQPVFEDARIEVKTDLSPRVPVIMADSDKIKQVILNLVRNAVQAMRSDGELTLVSRPVDEARQVEVLVADTGPGIPPERIEEIFNPFFTDKSGGTGLGLAVSQKIVVDHGGTLAARSELGHGATFIIRLPVTPADLSASARDSGDVS